MENAIAVSGSRQGLRPRDDEVDLFGITHTGRVRAVNQDHFLLATVHPDIVVHGSSLPDIGSLPLRGQRLGTLMLVADGVGGADDGGTAAKVATESIMRYVSSTLRSYHAAGETDQELHGALQDAALHAHDAVRAEADARRDGTRMATTLTLGVVVYPWLYVVQVGDSRAYLYTHGKLHQVTRDQTLAQQLVDEGAMKASDIRRSPLNNVLASAIGSDDATPVVTRISVAERGSTLVFCTDGLTKHVSDAELERACAHVSSAEQLCRDLLQLALDRGGVDNVTIVVGRAPLKDKRRT